MSKKIAIASIVLIVLGGISIPGGMYLHSYIDDAVFNSIDDALIGIQEESVSYIEPMVKQLGIPMTLHQIRETSIPFIHELLNATLFMMVINETQNIGTLEFLGVPILDPLGLYFDLESITILLIFEVSFSNLTTIKQFPKIKGISEWAGEDLNFNDAKSLIINGTETLPGLVADNEMGSGVLEYLTLYDEAIGNATLEMELANGYNTTWYKLSKLTDYYRNYFIPEAIPLMLPMIGDFMPELAGLNTTKEISYHLFYAQWANCTLFPNGTDFHDFDDSLPEGTYGFEVGRVYKPYLSKTSTLLLWNETNTSSLLNMTGIEKWVAAQENPTIYNELMIEFGLNSSQMDIILYWLWEESFSNDIIPTLIESDYGFAMPIAELCRLLLLEQWANGTVFGMVLFPDPGFALPLTAGIIYGFEVGIPIPTNMSVKSALALWDVTNSYSLVNDEGLAKWWSIGNKYSVVYNQIRDANYLDNNAMDIVWAWLPHFRDNIMPFLAQEAMGLPMDSTSFGNAIQIGTSTIGGIFIGLAGIGFTGNVVTKKKRVSSKTLNTIGDKVKKFEVVPKPAKMKVDVEVLEIEESEKTKEKTQDL